MSIEEIRPQPREKLQDQTQRQGSPQNRAEIWANNIAATDLIETIVLLTKRFDVSRNTHKLKHH